jgi:hypothetical protein
LLKGCHLGSENRTLWRLAWELDYVATVVFTSIDSDVPNNLVPTLATCINKWVCCTEANAANVVASKRWVYARRNARKK